MAHGCDSGAKRDSLVAAASEAQRRGDFLGAERLAQEALYYAPSDGSILKIAGDAAAHQEAFDRALEYYRRIPQTDLVWRAQGCGKAAQVLLLGKCQLSQAEMQFREALMLAPDNRDALDGLSFLLAMTGRRWESAPYYLALLRSGRFDLGHLLGVAVLEFQLNERTRLQRCRTLAPGDPLPLLGLARLDLAENNTSSARELLRESVRIAPDLLEAQARLGHVLLDGDEDHQLPTWRAKLPENASDHPEIWVVWGRWAQRQQQLPAAVRCYLEALRRDPNHQLAAAQIAVVLFSLGEVELSASFARRSQLLLRYHEVIYQLRSQPNNPQFMARAAQRAEAQGRLWEAWGWYEQLLRAGVGGERIRRHSDQLRAQLTSATPQVIVADHPAWSLEPDSWPLPAWDTSRRVVAGQDVPPVLELPVHFEDLARAVGIDFTYYNGHDPRKQGTRIYEVDGGGVAVLDYDLDGWPDIYFTQGCRWPPDPGQTEFFDGLFRNLGDGSFQHVSVEAGLRENGFGQGVAVGDFDNDGFPDLLIGNLGQNRLYRNCGDGTFEDVTDRAGLNGAVWTSSCVIADFNGDAVPDIYEVNYLKDEQMFDRACPDARGVARICPPLVFGSEQDRFFLGLADGTFRECGRDAGIHVGDGKGLGIVAADFDDSGNLSLFVANDVVENFFFYNLTPFPGAPPQFADQALVRGLAFADDGQAQACMGVAVEDINFDGRLDLFVANFYMEPNCLYLQQADHSFVDVNRSANLRDASFQMLGFGAQFIDGELDGWPDLIVTNGHLTDESDLGVPYRMRPQYFRNRGNALFDELQADMLGPFFEEKCLGRAIARVDWNRDGLEDLAITFLDRPVALLTNQTPRAGHFLAVQLRATRSARDAIGAKVTVNYGEHSRRRQLIAGDGYQNSCQRQLVFGLGAVPHVHQLEVVWPCGETQVWTDVPVDREWLIVQGREQLHSIPR